MFTLPTVLEEESLAEPTIPSVDPVPEQLTYRIIDDGTIHRKKKLIDSRGFTYNVKERGKETTYWQALQDVFKPASAIVQEVRMPNK